MIQLNFKGFFIIFIGALFFFYGYIEVNMLSALNEPLTKTFGTNSAELGVLSAWCFFSNVLFQIPAGLILDRFSIRKLILSNMALIIFSTFLFAFSPNLVIASIARFLSGFMMAFSLIISLKIASIVLLPTQMALASSLIVSIGILGGVFANLAVAWLVEVLNWRVAVSIVGFLGIFLFILFWIFIKVERKEQEKVPSIMSSLKEVISYKANWFAGFFITFINFPVAILGALFGITYISQVYGLSTKLSASITSFLFFGMILGSPFF